MFGKKELDGLRDLYLDELKDVYDAEHRILDALPKLKSKAHHGQLAKAFDQHLQETKGQIQRLEQVFEKLGEKPDRKTCEGVKGLLEEGEESMKAKGDDATLDAALIAAAQRVEHYEMAVYGTLRTWARRLGYEDQARLLEQTLQQEENADATLTQLAESGINREAAVHA